MYNYYYWLKVAHIFFVISWMVGLLYLPRIYAYHSKVEVGSESDKIFQVMELRLIKIIMNTSMIGTYVFGLLMAYIYGFDSLGKWFHIKFSLVLFLSFIHGMLSKWRKDFVNGCNKHSEKFYRLFNEIPAIIMLFIIILVVIKPFD